VLPVLHDQPAGTPPANGAGAAAAGGGPGLTLGLNAVIVAVTDDRPRVLTVRRTDHALSTPGPETGRPDGLPFGPLDPRGDRTIELGLRGWVRQQTGLELGYVEQLYTFGDRHRDPRERAGGPRVLSIAYLALVHEGGLSGAGLARWRDVYAFLPWEDWREGRPGVVENDIEPRLRAWAREAPERAVRRERQERAALAFGTVGGRFDAEAVLERYELMYGAGLVQEHARDHPEAAGGPGSGEAMALDHRRLLATALGRLRGKLKYRPVVFELLGDDFTLLQLQRVVEALAGMRLHKQNFRRLVEKSGLVEPTGASERLTGGRPAALFRFRRELLRERRAAGVGLPGARRASA
jgi:hypothetical protein